MKPVIKKKSPRKPKPQVLLNLGCGIKVLPGFINLDKVITEKGIRSRKGLYANAEPWPDGAKLVNGDMVSLLFKDNYADYIECLEALEHLPFRDVERACREMYRVLKPGGELCLFVPDMDEMCKGWLENVTGTEEAPKVFDHNTFFGLIQQFFGNQLHKGEFHTAGFTPTYLKGMLNAVGFPIEGIKIEIVKRGDHPPLFRGAVWDPRDIMIIGMDKVTVKK